AANLGAPESLDGQAPADAHHGVAAIVGKEVDQIEVDLPPELKIEPSADVPPAHEGVEDVDLVLLQLADLVDAGRPPQHVAAEVAVEPQRRVEVDDVAAPVVAAPARRLDVE